MRHALYVQDRNVLGGGLDEREAQAVQSAASSVLARFVALVMCLKRLVLIDRNMKPPVRDLFVRLGQELEQRQTKPSIWKSRVMLDQYVNS
jgi:hypothetical protein